MTEEFDEGLMSRRDRRYIARLRFPQEVIDAEVARLRKAGLHREATIMSYTKPEAPKKKPPKPPKGLSN